MKLRFRKNSLRLRVNQREVQALASGGAIREEVLFPGDARLTYSLQTSAEHAPQARCEGGEISVLAPEHLVHTWAGSEEIGLYFQLPAASSMLKIAIEKDLECVDEPSEEKDPDAFPRSVEKVC